MTVNPLANPPVAPNGDPHRAMFLWTKTTFDADTEQQAIINFCGTQGVDVLFIDAYGWIGNTNWDLTKLKQMISKCHASGILCYALWGNVDWQVNQAWVQEKIVRRYEQYQAVAVGEEQFDGMCLDCEYYTDDTTYPASTNLPKLMDLVKSIQARGILVGMFAGFYLKDNTGSRASVSYNGKSAQDGEHMMDVADFVVVGTYRDHADDGGSESGPGQKTLFQPWYDYATTQGVAAQIYAASETRNVSPAYTTYYGSTKSAMETEHTNLSNAFTSVDNSAFVGQAVQDYAGWSAMS